MRVYAYAFLAAILIAGALYYRHTLIVEGEAKVLAADRDAVDRQREAVSAAEKVWLQKLQDAGAAHDAEITVLAHTTDHHVMRCDARSTGPVPGPSGVSQGGSTAAGVVPGSPELHPDIGPSLDLLARRADKLAADARELNALTH